LFEDIQEEDLGGCLFEKCTDKLTLAVIEARKSDALTR